MKSIGFILTLLVLILSYLSGSSQIQSKEKAEIIRKTKLNYLLWLPAGYATEKTKKFPLLIFLHGSGERGENLDLVKKHGPPSFIESKPEFPFITVSPQCPIDSKWMWKVDELQMMLIELQEKYRIDPDRIYLTGLSMGGFGTWAWAISQPGQFAAIAPVCGGGYSYYAYELINTPVWAFHGDADEVVPVKNSVEMVEAVNLAGGSARITIYPGVGHDSWIQAYREEELYNWFLSHNKKRTK